MMEAAIKTLEQRQSEVQTDIAFQDRAIAQYRRSAAICKEQLASLYKERDQLAGAIAKLKRSR
jgi:peptidoglycan hydrolase CwlO-like protein